MKGKGFFSRAAAAAAAVLSLCFAASPALGQYTSNAVYDAARRPVLWVGPDPDGAGALLRPAEKYSYDAEGRLTKVERGSVTSAAGANWTLIETSAEITYDAAGGKVKVVTPAGVTQHRYDGVGREICAAVRMNPSAFGSLPTDACALGTQGADGPDRITRTTYDLAGQVTKIERGFGTPQVQTYATYSYTANGQQATVADARGNLSTMEYDGFDRLSKLRFPVTTVPGGTSSTTDYEEYGYDQASKRTSVRRRDGQVISYTYDLLGREIVKDIPGGTAADVYTAYDLRGLVLSSRFASTSGSGVIATYDKAGRMLTEATFGRTLSYAYDDAGNRTKVTWPETAFFVDYLYNPANQLTEMREKGLTTAATKPGAFTYDQLGRRTVLGRNQLTTTWSYDTSGRLAGLAHNPSTSTTTYDDTWSFTYSPASQLLTRTNTNTTYRWTPPAAGTTSNTFDGLNRDAGVVALEPDCAEADAGYDCRGNLKRNGDWTYTYDVENRLIGASKTGTTATLTYDPMGRLASTVVVTTGTTTTNFLYDGPRLVAEYSGTGTVLHRYAHGPGVDEPIVWYNGSSTSPSAANRRWLIANQQGSVIAWSNSNGQVQDVHRYGPWGEPSNWSGSRFQYTGQITLPELQLYYYKARVYDPASGRFLQTDPIGYQDDLNLYAYVGGDPVNKTDPTGMWQQQVRRPAQGAPSRTTYVGNQGRITVYLANQARIQNLETQLFGAPQPSIRCSGVCYISPATVESQNARIRDLELRIIGKGATTPPGSGFAPGVGNFGLPAYGGNGWPTNRGAVGFSYQVTLKPGQMISRYGSDTGSYFAPAGTSFGARGLKPYQRDFPVRTFMVTSEFNVTASTVRSAFGAPGGGVQYESTMSAAELVSMGYLRVVP